MSGGIAGRLYRDRREGTWSILADISEGESGDGSSQARRSPKDASSYAGIQRSHGLAWFPQFRLLVAEQ